MVYEISWRVPDRILEVTLPNICDDDFVRKFDSDLRTVFEAASGPVHILADMSGITVYPSTRCVLRFKSFKHPRMGRLITIKGMTTPIKRFLYGLVTRVSGVRSQDFFTGREALSYLISLERIGMKA